jgi:hypothetical protein
MGNTSIVSPVALPFPVFWYSVLRLTGMETPPLAQALYKSVEVGQEIPAHLYRAVAEILAYIYRLTRWSLPGR